jgi:hypothetical protein
VRLARHLIRPAALAALAALVAGCALMQRRPVPWSLPKVQDGPIQGRWVQTLALEREGKSMELLAVIERDGGDIVLVGMTPMGQRLIRIRWSDGKVDQDTDPNIPVRIDGGSILRDVVFANWPEESLKAAFAGTGWSAGFDGPRRTLAWNGKPWLEVRPEPVPADTGRTADSLDLGDPQLVDHIAEGYRIRVTTVERSGP